MQISKINAIQGAEKTLLCAKGLKFTIGPQGGQKIIIMGFSGPLTATKRLKMAQSLLDNLKVIFPTWEIAQKADLGMVDRTLARTDWYSDIYVERFNSGRLAFMGDGWGASGFSDDEVVFMQ